MNKQQELRQHLNECYRRMPVLPEFLSGSMQPEQLKDVMKRHYAEVKTFINQKLPARMRICPHDAIEAKSYFHDLYREEQGNFGKRKNHADILSPICFYLGSTEEELEDEYQKYWPRFSSLYSAAPSQELMLQELAISYAWESYLAGAGRGIGEILINDYQLGPEVVVYFPVHDHADDIHSGWAEKALLTYMSDQDSTDLVYAVIEKELVTDNYQTWEL